MCSVLFVTPSRAITIQLFQAFYDFKWWKRNLFVSNNRFKYPFLIKKNNLQTVVLFQVFQFNTNNLVREMFILPEMKPKVYIFLKRRIRRVVAIEKEAFGSPSTAVANFTFIKYIHIPTWDTRSQSLESVSTCS